MREAIKVGDAYAGEIEYVGMYGAARSLPIRPEHGIRQHKSAIEAAERVRSLYVTPTVESADMAGEVVG